MIKTMQIHDILSPETTVAAAEEDSQKRVLERLSEMLYSKLQTQDATEDAAERTTEGTTEGTTEEATELSQQSIFEHLIAREKLGSTGLGHGIAIPHARLKGLTNVSGALIQLTHPIPFHAVDEVPVDIFFAILVPEDADQKHLQMLATLAKLFSQSSFRDNLRQAKDSEGLYKVAIEGTP